MHADERQALETSEAGDIVAVVGLKHSATGDTLCSKSRQVVLEGMEFPEPVISMSIEPYSVKDKDELVRVLGLLTRDDPSFSWSLDEETGQMIISGVGELHLEVLRHRIERDFKMQIRVGEPRVAYHQTITRVAEKEAVFEKALPGRNMYAGVRLRIEPDAEAVPFTVVNELPAEQVPRLFHDAVEASVSGAVSSGGELGYPLTGVKVTLLGGTSKEGASNDTAFGHAAHLAFEAALAAAGPVLLEPVMDFEIRCPSEFLAGIDADLNGLRARVRSLATDVDPVLIRGSVPLAEIFGYSTALRSLSQGRATFSVEPRSYEPVPEAVARERLG
jgi:elongation factor G